MDTPFGREGSKGSEGSACPWQAGSKGGGIACGDEYKVSVTFLPPPACQGEGDRVSGGRGWLQSSHSPAGHSHSEPPEWYTAVWLCFMQSKRAENIKNKAPMIHSALFSIAFLCYNYGSETAVYMISLVGETAPSILKIFEESLLKPWVGFFHVLIT